MELQAIVNVAVGLSLAPLAPGVINRTKALVAGRKGPPLLQLYYDLWKLLHKGAVYSRTTSWLFRAGPMIALAALVTAVLLVPLGGARAAWAFGGDLILLACLLGLARFVTVLAALDTGSAFEGMGASREATFAALAEPAFLLALAVLARLGGGISLSSILGSSTWSPWPHVPAELVLVAAAILIIFLAENARIPVDDPNTHMELTMIHEAMILDHGGVDLAFILYGSTVKMWVLGAILVQALLPTGQAAPAAGAAMCLGGMLVLAVVVGVIESVMARLRMSHVPRLLAAALALSLLALVLVLRRSA